MKKSIALVLIMAVLLTVFTGCSQAKKEAKQAEKTEQLKLFYDTKWVEDSGYNEQDVLPTQEAAEAIAQQIFDSIKEKHNVADCELQYTTFYEAQNAWMVVFFKPWKEGELMRMGGGCTIALNKADGRVMRIFWGQ